MQLRQFIAIILMLILGVGPALSSTCITSCAMNDAQASKLSADTVSTANQTLITDTTTTVTTNSVAMSAEHCSMNADEMGKANQHPSHSPTSSHKNCTMASCHVVQVPPLMANVSVFFVDLAQVSRLHVHFFGISADLTPPTKPPA